MTEKRHVEGRGPEPKVEEKAATVSEPSSACPQNLAQMREYLRGFAVNHAIRKCLEFEAFARYAKKLGVYEQVQGVTDLNEIQDPVLREAMRRGVEEAVQLIQAVSDEVLLREGPERVAEKWARNPHVLVTTYDRWGEALVDLVRRDGTRAGGAQKGKTDQENKGLDILWWFHHILVMSDDPILS